MTDFAIIAYSGHAYVVLDSLKALGENVLGYFEQTQKELNPYSLVHLGPESTDLIQKYPNTFVCIGDNQQRKKLIEKYNLTCASIIDPSALLSEHFELGKNTFIGRRVTVNSMASVGNGVILNTNSVIEHDCILADNVHIAPGAVLCGNVNVGAGSIIGANSTIIPNISIGTNVVVGAGAVVTKDIPDNHVFIGKTLKERKWKN